MHRMIDDIEPGDLCMVTESVWGRLNGGQSLGRLSAHEIVMCISKTTEPTPTTPGVEMRYITLLSSSRLFKVNYATLVWLQRITR